MLVSSIILTSHPSYPTFSLLTTALSSSRPPLSATSFLRDIRSATSLPVSRRRLKSIRFDDSTHGHIAATERNWSELSFQFSRADVNRPLRVMLRRV